MKLVIGYIIFTAIGIVWFFNRLGDKDGSDKRWFIFPLDVIFITPLLPYAALIGKISRKKKK